MSCKRSQHEFSNCETVPCPCPGDESGPCTGRLRSEGRNVSDNLTFIECDECHCLYVAEDFPESRRRKE